MGKISDLLRSKNSGNEIQRLNSPNSNDEKYIYSFFFNSSAVYEAFQIFKVCAVAPVAGRFFDHLGVWIQSISNHIYLFRKFDIVLRRSFTVLILYFFSLSGCYLLSFRTSTHRNFNFHWKFLFHLTEAYKRLKISAKSFQIFGMRKCKIRYSNSRQEKFNSQ